jgi:hypothetical protein
MGRCLLCTLQRVSRLHGDWQFVRQSRMGVSQPQILCSEPTGLGARFKRNTYQSAVLVLRHSFRLVCRRTMASLVQPFQSPHRAIRHDAGSRGAGADRVASTSMKPVLRYLRIAFSVTCLIACVLLIVLWVRSYSVWDILSYSTALPPDGEEDEVPRQVDFESWRGVCSVYAEPLSSWETEPATFLNRWQFSTKAPPVWLPQTHWSFEYDPILESREIKVPHWFFVISCSALAAVPWFPWSKRFSLRTLLIATTLLAVVLGLAVWASR